MIVCIFHLPDKLIFPMSNEGYIRMSACIFGINVSDLGAHKVKHMGAGRFTILKRELGATEKNILGAPKMN